MHLSPISAPKSRGLYSESRLWAALGPKVGPLWVYFGGLKSCRLVGLEIAKKGKGQGVQPLALGTTASATRGVTLCAL